MKIRVPLLRELVMLGLGTAGMARELFLEPRPDLVRVGICIPLMLGPAAVWVWLRARTPERSPSSLSSGSRSPSRRS